MSTKRKHEDPADDPVKRTRTSDAHPRPSAASVKTPEPFPAPHNLEAARASLDLGDEIKGAPASTTVCPSLPFTQIPPELRVKIYKLVYNPAEDRITEFFGLIFSCKTIYNEISGAEGELVKIAAKHRRCQAKRISKKFTLPVRFARPTSLADVHRPTVFLPRELFADKNWNKPAFALHIDKTTSALKEWPVKEFSVEFHGAISGRPLSASYFICSPRVKPFLSLVALDREIAGERSWIANASEAPCRLFTQMGIRYTYAKALTEKLYRDTESVPDEDTMDDADSADSSDTEVPSS